MAQIFDVGVPAINKHLNNIYEEEEIEYHTTISKMEIVQIEGKREVKRRIDFLQLRRHYLRRLSY